MLTSWINLAMLIYLNISLLFLTYEMVMTAMPVVVYMMPNELGPDRE